MLAASLVIHLFLGLNYGWSIFVRPLELEYGWSRADTAVIFTVSMIGFTFGSLASGHLLRWLQPRTIVRIAGLLFLAGFVLSARISTLPQLMVTYGVLCGFGVGIAYNTVIATILLWFPEKRGTVSGIMLLFYGSGTFVLGSLTSMLLDSPLGWRTTMSILGALFFVILFLGSFLIVPPPLKNSIDSVSSRSESAAIDPASCMNACEMDGPADLGTITARADLGTTAARADRSPREMLRDRVFWLFYGWIVLHGGSGMAIFAHAAPGASDLGASAMTAAVLLGLLSIGSGCGRFAAGTLFDRKGPAFTMGSVSVTYLLAAAILQVAFQRRSLALLGVAYLLCGAAFGSVASLVPVFTGSVFGQHSFPMNFGIMLTYSIFSVSLGSSVGGLLRDWTGDYALTYRMIFVYVGLGLAIAFFLFRPVGLSRRRKGHQPLD